MAEKGGEADAVEGEETKKERRKSEAQLKYEVGRVECSSFAGGQRARTDFFFFPLSSQRDFVALRLESSRIGVPSRRCMRVCLASEDDFFFSLFFV